MTDPLFAYRFFLWLHIIAVISWMAGVLYLYRLLINHREHGVTSRDNHELLKGMEYRLYRYITMPAMGVAILAGIGMIYLNPALFKSGWFHAKLTTAILLTVATVWCKPLMRRAAADPSTLPSSKTLRILNEIPTIFMLIIVWMVIFKPF